MAVSGFCYLCYTLQNLLLLGDSKGVDSCSRNTQRLGKLQCMLFNYSGRGIYKGEGYLQLQGKCKMTGRNESTELGRAGRMGGVLGRSKGEGQNRLRG